MFVDRDQSGKIIGRYNVQQYEGQEELADDAPELLLIAALYVKLSDIDVAFGNRVKVGMPYNGKVIQIEDDDRANISGVAARAMGVVAQVPGMTWPQGFYWRTMDNSPLPLDAPGMLAMSQAVADHYTALLYNKGALKDAANAAPDAATVEAIDANSGW